MNKIIFKSGYVTAKFNATSKIYTITYHPTTEHITDSEWQNLMFQMIELIEKYKPLYMIDDNSARKYNYAPDTQLWMLNLFIDCWHKIGLQKYVQIIPNDTIGEITVFQIEELALINKKLRFEYKLLYNLADAEAWINESVNKL